MAQAGYTPIQLYFSTTAAAVPVAGNLANGELAINITDGKLYYKNNSGVVSLLASNATSAPVLTFSAGTTGFTPSTATSGVVTLAGTLNVANGGTGQTSYTDGQLLIGNSTGNTLTKATLTAGSNITITNGSGAITIAATGGGSAATPTALGTVYGNTSASGTIAVLGYQAGFTHSSGVGVNALGYQAAYTANTTIDAFGYQTLKLATGGNNVAFGSLALAANTTGQANTAVGRDALLATTTGSFNSVVGHQAAIGNTTGEGLTVIGRQALYTNTTGNYNVAIGRTALFYNSTGSNNVAVGNQALENTTGSSNTAVGYQAGYSNTSGVITAFGYRAGYSQTSNAIYLNTFIGFEAGYNTTGAGHTFVGHNAGKAMAGGNWCTAVGWNALAANLVSACGAFGVSALQSNTTGTDNNAFGYAALAGNTTGSFNTAFGHLVLNAATTASGNTGVGYQALVANTTGYSNTAIGEKALFVNTTGLYNTVMGNAAGDGVTTGSYNVLIGSEVARSTVVLTTGQLNVVIGAYARTSIANANKQFVIGYGVQGQADTTITIGSNVGKIYNSYESNATWTQTSDGRLKTNVQNDALGLSFINRLRPVKFNWKPSNEVDPSLPQYNETNLRDTSTVIHGLIAQEVKTALDAEGVSTFAGWDVGSDGVQAISREMFISPLIKAIQELSAQVETLKSEIATLKGA